MLSCSNGMQREPTPVRTFDFALAALVAAPHRTHEPVAMLGRARNLSRLSSYNRRYVCCGWRALSRKGPSAPPRAALLQPSTIASSDTTVFSRQVARDKHALAGSSMSRGPISSRTGTPFISYSATSNRRYSRLCRPSRGYRRGAACRAISVAFSTTLGLCHRDRYPTITCIGATAGGKASPLSSPCVMIIPPIIARRAAPRRLVRVNKLVFLVGILDTERARKPVAEIVAGRGLKRFFRHA